MRANLATLLLLACTLAGIAWTLHTGLVAGQPEAATCNLVFPAMQRRPVLAALFAVSHFCVLTVALPGVELWRVFVIFVSSYSAGHLIWRPE